MFDEVFYDHDDDLAAEHADDDDGAFVLAEGAAAPPAAEELLAEGALSLAATATTLAGCEQDQSSHAGLLAAEVPGHGCGAKAVYEEAAAAEVALTDKNVLNRVPLSSAEARRQWKLARGLPAATK